MDTKIKNHAELSPSSAERWMRCSGSVALSRGLANPSSEYAKEGTCAHFLAALCLEEGSDAKKYYNREINILKNGRECFAKDAGDEKVVYRIVVYPDFIDSVQEYLDYIRAIVDSTQGILHVEQRLSLEEITGEKGAQGTSDAVIITTTEMIIVDLKFGMGVRVEAENNPQLMLYALAAMDKYSIIHDFEDVRIVIAQPRLNHISEFVYSVPEMNIFRAEVAIAADNTRAADAPLTPSEDACRWCPAKATCPALSRLITETIGAEFEDLSEDVLGVKHLDPEDLGLRLKAVDLIEGWCKSVRTGVERLLLDGVGVPGFKLVQGKKGNRSWGSPSDAETVLKSMRLKVDEMYDMKLISPTTAEKLLKDTPKRWNRVIPLIVQREGGPSVAPVSDKRPAMVITPVGDDMEDLTNDDLV